MDALFLFLTGITGTSAPFSYLVLNMHKHATTRIFPQPQCSFTCPISEINFALSQSVYIYTVIFVFYIMNWPNAILDSGVNELLHLTISIGQDKQS
jgi:hypothetical protein